MQLGRFLIASQTSLVQYLRPCTNPVLFDSDHIHRQIVKLYKDTYIGLTIYKAEAIMMH